MEEESTVGNSDNIPVRPNNLPLTYDRNKIIKYVGNNDCTKNNGLHIWRE